jgi:hypothetical protein
MKLQAITNLVLNIFYGKKRGIPSLRDASNLWVCTPDEISFDAEGGWMS